MTSTHNLSEVACGGNYHLVSFLRPPWGLACLDAQAHLGGQGCWLGLGWRALLTAEAGRQPAKKGGMAKRPRLQYSSTATPESPIHRTFLGISRDPVPQTGRCRWFRLRLTFCFGRN